MNKGNESSYRDHEKQSADVQRIGFAVITLSDTRTPANDKSGQLIQQMIHEAGHQTVAYHLVPDDPERISAAIKDSLENSAVEVVITNGSTGISHRDTAVEVVSQFLDKELKGFGELFRNLSYEEIGAAAMLSRAIGGTIGRCAMFALPGSSNAVRLGMKQLILPQVGHIIQELNKDLPGGLE
ncbi:MogA/MoaB family molybdenum cofactor biosynthesis protein [Planctomycetaceae bacterium]|jgi:molybdopterin adenylyltransferase|nr:MogA/MoaB family molybdenum cofactor biosynthesis protein [bacterium]MDC0262247.1 MogA/MoaB family molybdenum cofactor biosynthesis protein [Planctomycetaceae bacterium]MDG2390554.1 MogA/MoaB family molybdenum cofactor biosynthesis protein [Planctomycetaceae bacterium]